MSTSSHSKILIVGAGTAGISIAARLIRKDPTLKNNVSIVDPSDKHYYQPFFTLIGAGDAKLDNNVRSQQSLIPNGVKFINDAITLFHPENNSVDTKNGNTLT